MGDILFSHPFLRAIRKAYPEAYIACVVVPEYADLLTNNPWINEVHVLSDNNKISSLREKISFTRIIKGGEYDTCFFLKPSNTKSIIAAFAGIKERIGFVGKNGTLTKAVEIPKGKRHRADIILSLAGAVGVTEADGTYEYVVSDIDKAHADAILHKKKAGVRYIIGINPGSNWEAKKWLSNNFVRVARKLLLRFDDIEIMITGAEKDSKLAKKMVEDIDSDRCYSVAGETGLKELAELFRRCILVISADSGPLHLASAVKTTTIGLFGPTSHEITGTIGKGKNIIIQNKIDCKIPCYEKECKKKYVCMGSITVEKVFDVAEKVLSKNI